MIPYKFKGATSALHVYSTDVTRETVEHENGGYSAWALKANIENSVLWGCSAWSHFKLVKASILFCATGIISPLSASQDKIEHLTNYSTELSHLMIFMIVKVFFQFDNVFVCVEALSLL